MKDMITLKVTTGQIDGFASVVADATRKKTREELNTFAEAGHLDSATMQRVLANGDKIAAAATKAGMEKLREIASGIFGCLKRISTGKNVVIAATKGTETLASANDVFNYIDSDFNNWGCDKVEEATLETPVEVYEQIEDASYRKIFGGFGQNLDRLRLTTPQIKKFFAAEADNWLREDGWAVYHFLFKVGDNFFVVYAFGDADGDRRARVRSLSDESVWGAGHRFRFVLPQLDA